MEVYDIDKFKIGENQDEGDTLSILSKDDSEVGGEKNYVAEFSFGN